MLESAGEIFKRQERRLIFFGDVSDRFFRIFLSNSPTIFRIELTFISFSGAISFCKRAAIMSLGLSFVPRSQIHWCRGRRMSIEHYPHKAAKKSDPRAATICCIFAQQASSCPTVCIPQQLPLEDA